MKTYLIHFKKKSYSCKNDETIVEAFLRQGVSLDFSCRKGSCQACIIKCDSGNIPTASQKGLREEYITNKYFLPCCCHPENDMTIRNIPPHELYNSAIIHEKKILSSNVCKLIIEPAQPLDYKPGQYVNLRRTTDGLARSYSLASSPVDYFLEFHIRKMNTGQLSNWIFNELNSGDEIDIQGPIGECHYGQIADKNTPIILAASGTGLAPLLGIFKDALQHKHQGEVYLLHGGQTDADIYMHQYMIELCKKNKNYNYNACVKNTQMEWSIPYNIQDALNLEIKKSQQPMCFLAGSAEFIQSTKKTLHNHAISDEHIFFDVFEYQNRRKISSPKTQFTGRKKTDTSVTNQHDEHIQTPAKDEEMWEALDSGKKLKIILDEFYARVYKDEKLSGFFSHSTQQRSSEKQYLFMRQLFTGEKIYFGDRPKNAHHWMVINDELFDHRENLLIECLQSHNVPEHLIQRWVKIDESFRKDIVKNKAWPKIINGVELPLDGFETLTMGVGTLCDGCQQPIELGESARYHVRLGLTYCQRCMNNQNMSSTNTQQAI